MSIATFLTRQLGLRPKLNNQKFWNRRYSTDPTLGSGVGSRGENLKIKRTLLEASLSRLAIRSVLDLGCGDVAVLEGLSIPEYLGVDISNVIVEKNRQKVPQWRFVYGDIQKVQLNKLYGMVICFDVLIHQDRKEKYLRIVDRCVHQFDKVLIISGYEEPPPYANQGFMFFYEPLSQSLERYQDLRITRVAEYFNQLVVFEANRSSRLSGSV